MPIDRDDLAAAVDPFGQCRSVLERFHHENLLRCLLVRQPDAEACARPATDEGILFRDRRDVGEKPVALLGAGWRNQSIDIALDRRIVCTVNGLIDQGGEEIKFVQLLKRPVLPTCKRAGIGNGATASSPASSGVAAAATGITTAPACGQ